MIRRVLRDPDQRTRKVVYAILVRPSLEYTCRCTVWDSHFRKDIVSLGQTKNLALIFICNKKGWISFTQLGETNAFESLEERRAKLKVLLNLCNRIMDGNENINIGVEALSLVNLAFVVTGHHCVFPTCNNIFVYSVVGTRGHNSVQLTICTYLSYTNPFFLTFISVITSSTLYLIFKVLCFTLNNC